MCAVDVRLYTQRQEDNFLLGNLTLWHNGL